MRMFNKKGQTTTLDTKDTSGSLIYTVIALVIVILALVIFYKYFLVQKSNLETPEFAVQACKADVANNLYGDFCAHFRQVSVSSDNIQYMTCDYKFLASILEAQNIKILSCQPSLELRAKEQCKLLIEKEKADEYTRVNDVVCAREISCKDVGGIISSERNPKGCKSDEIQVAKGFSDAAKGACCIGPETKSPSAVSVQEKKD